MKKKILENIEAPVLLATFHLDEMLIGIELDSVQEINRNVDLTEVPHSPSFIKGIINLRGNIVTVIDLKVILGLGNTEICENTSLVVVNFGEEHIALLVDEVADVVEIDSSLLEPVPGNLNDIDPKFVRYIYKLNGGLLVWLNIEEILNVDINEVQLEQKN